MDQKLKTYDLTYPIEEGMPTFNAPWHCAVNITQLGRHRLEGRETRKISFGTHTGTHIDAPLHFISNGKSIDCIDLEKLTGSVTIIDLTEMKENDCVTADTLSKYDISKRIILKFGWGKHWGEKDFYNSYPFLSLDAAEYLIKCGTELLGMDTPSPDDSRIHLGSENDSVIHKFLLKNEIILVEYLANLDKLEDYSNWNLAAVPLKIKGADGSPARVYLFKCI